MIKTNKILLIDDREFGIFVILAPCGEVQRLFLVGKGPVINGPVSISLSL